MLRKNFMKRLSKSASDISGCKKKSHSTSPEEEEKHFHDYEEHDDRARPASAASCRSVPEFSDQDGIRSSGRSTKSAASGTLARTARRLMNSRQQPSEVGIRNVAVYGKGHQGFLSLLKERFSRSSSRPRHQQQEQPQQQLMQSDVMVTSSANVTPEMVRRRIEASADESLHCQSRRTSTPEVVRIRTTATPCEASTAASEEAARGESHNETRRQGLTKNAPKNVTAKACDHEVGKPIPPSEAEPIKCPQRKASEAATTEVVRMPQLHQQQQIRQESLSSSNCDGPSEDMVSYEDPHVAELKSYNLYHLHVCLRNGRELIARDSGGTSDPYVKFYWKAKQVYKSKTIDKDLNPVWDESFILAIDDPFVPLEIKVYDHDWAFRDDFMGEGKVPLSELSLDKLTEHVVTLKEEGSTEYLGQVVLGLRLVPKPSSSDHHHHSNVDTGSLLTHFRSGSIESTAHPLKDTSAHQLFHGATSKKLSWSAVVNVVLIEGVGLKAMDLEGTSDPYCKVRLGNDRYKTKVIYETLNPKWLEQFDLSLFEDNSQELEITVWDKDQRSKDDFMGRCSVDLSKLEHEKTHQLWAKLEEGTGKLFLLLTISGRTNFEPPIVDLDKYREDEAVIESRMRSFSLRSTFNDLNTIGFLQVKIFSAKGLYAADLGGKSDPFVVLELDNTRLQTHTEYKTITPTWNRVLNLSVGDIHSVLHVSVYDEDRNHKSEFLGKIAIQLIRIESGRKRWFALKDKKLRMRAKGNNPQILLQLDLHYNTVRAAIRTLNPKEEKFMSTVEKFKRQVFLNNVMRIKAIIMDFVDLGKFVESCLEWESPVRSIVTFVAYLVTCYYCEPFWFPIFLLLVFVRNYIVISYLSTKSGPRHAMHHLGSDEDFANFELEDDDECLMDKDGGGDKSEEKKTLKEKLQAVQDVTATVQNALGYVAHLAEGVKNTFNFSVPFLSWLAIVSLIAIAAFLYYTNLRYLLMAWGVNKFSKKLIRPNYVPNNELLDFLSRVPDDEELKDYRELKLTSDESSPHHHQTPTKSAATGVSDKKKKKA